MPLPLTTAGLPAPDGTDPANPWQPMVLSRNVRLCVWTRIRRAETVWLLRAI